MKIGQITKHYFPVTGGQQTYIQNLIDVFERNGIASTIFQPYAPGADSQKHVVVTSPVPLLQRLDRFISNIGWFIFNLELRFAQKTIQEQDVIISHYSFHYPPIKRHNKVIILSHGVLWSSRLKTPFDRILYKKDISLRGNKRIFIVANDTDFIRRIGINVEEGTNYFKEVADRTWFIPNCVDDSFFCPDASPKEKVLIVPRNIRPDRGIDLVIKAFSIFSKKNQGYKLKIIGGPRKGKYYKYCAGLVSDMKLSESVLFEGSSSWEKMRDHYRAATLTIIPTIEKEGTSLSALESMSCGTPVVGTNVAGLRDLPILKAEPNAGALAEKMAEALDRLEDLSKTQLNAIKTVFNLKNWENAWMEVINKVYNSK